MNLGDRIEGYRCEVCGSALRLASLARSRFDDGFKVEIHAVYCKQRCGYWWPSDREGKPFGPPREACLSHIAVSLTADWKPKEE